MHLPSSITSKIKENSWALMDGRSHIEPGDVQSVFSAIAEHRLTPAEQHSRSAADLVAELLDQIAIP